MRIVKSRSEAVTGRRIPAEGPGGTINQPANFGSAYLGGHRKSYLIEGAKSQAPPRTRARDVVIGKRTGVDFEE